MDFHIVGISIKFPGKIGNKLQNILSLYGCVIRHRIGLNREGVDDGIIILDLNGDKKQIDNLLNELENLKEIQYKQIIF